MTTLTSESADSKSLGLGQHTGSHFCCGGGCVVSPHDCAAMMVRPHGQKPLPLGTTESLGGLALPRVELLREFLCNSFCE